MRFQPSYSQYSTDPYSFQAQEHDNELKGDGNSLNYKYRMHDPRLGRFFAIDPLSKGYPWNSPYAFSENDVVSCIELEGAEKWKVVHYKDQNNVIVKTVITLYTAKDAYAGMKKGVGILYMSSTIYTNGPGSEKFTHSDNNNSSFFTLPQNRWTARGMTGDRNFYDLQGRGVTASPEEAIERGLRKTPSGYPMTEQTITYPTYTREWHFENDKSNAFYGSPSETAEMNNYVNEMAVLLQENPGFIITVEGHTSSPESADYNLKLSQERADFVRSEILKILPDGGKDYKTRVNAVGYGETKPIVADDNVPNPTNDPLIKSQNEKNQNTNRRTIVNVSNNSTY
jgi:RHS repeat-associated protein